MCVVQRLPWSRDVPLQSCSLYWITWMFRMHVWDNQKLEKCYILSHISYEWNTFADLGIFVYAICHSEVSPVRTMCLYESFDYSLLNCKVMQICNIIHSKGIRMLGWWGILRTENVWERNIPFEVAPILTIFLYESERMFFITKYVFETFRMYV